MPLHETLDVGMLPCFSTGCRWSIASILRTRAVIGESAAFAPGGYALGLASKPAPYGRTGALSPPFYVCAWNVPMIRLDLVLTLRFQGAATGRDVEGGPRATRYTA